MRVAAVVLDMDGLMLDTEPLYKGAWQRAAEELGYDLDDVLYRTFVGRPTGDCERDLVRHFGGGFPMEQFRSRWPELWRTSAGQGIDTKPGLSELLAFANERELALAVATSSDRDYTEFSLRQTDLWGRFAVVVTGEQIVHGKPAPDIYLEAARRLALAPSQCVALEDSDAGIVAANRAGMVPLLIPDVKVPSDEAIAAAFRVLPSLHEARQLIGALLDAAA